MFGKYAAFIVPAYMVTLVVIVFMVAWIRLQYSARKKELAILEGSGIYRRSDKSTQAGSGAAQ